MSTAEEVLRYCELKQQGGPGSYRGNSPFRSGSDSQGFTLIIDDDEYGAWYDHVSGEGGSLYELADQLNIERPSNEGSRFGSSAHTPRPPQAPAQLVEPPDQWKARALAFTTACRNTLWSPAGQHALNYLRSRQLEDQIIWDAWLGYNPRPRRASREAWGLPLDGNRVMYAWGHAIVIPWFISGQVWRVRFRRFGDHIKKGERYKQLAGCGNVLYMADSLRVGKNAIVVEGEIDALTLRKHAPSGMMAVATGGASSARRVKWIAKLALCERVLLAFDADEAGEQATKYWLHALKANAKIWRVPWGDANDMARAGADLSAWMAAGLSTEKAAEEPTLDHLLNDAGWIIESFSHNDEAYAKGCELYKELEDAVYNGQIGAAYSIHAQVKMLSTGQAWKEVKAAQGEQGNALYL